MAETITYAAMNEWLGGTHKLPAHYTEGPADQLRLTVYVPSATPDAQIAWVEAWYRGRHRRSGLRIAVRIVRVTDYPPAAVDPWWNLLPEQESPVNG
jgi:hypothetical protein